MLVKLIIVQYKQPYPGAYMPNVVDAWDEFTLDENYEGFEESLAKQQKLVDSGEFEAVRVANIEVDSDAVLALFQHPTIPAKIQEDPDA